MHFRYYSLARVDINLQIDVQALYDPKTARDLAQQRLREVFLPTSGILIQATERQNVGVY